MAKKSIAGRTVVDESRPVGNLVADNQEVERARRAEEEARGPQDVEVYRKTTLPDGKTVNSRLTRAGMEKVIRDGGSVMHGREIITNVDDLPSEAELAEGDEAAERVALDNIERQQRALDAQRNRLVGAKGGKKASGRAKAAGKSDEAKEGDPDGAGSDERGGTSGEGSDAT